MKNQNEEEEKKKKNKKEKRKRRKRKRRGRRRKRRRRRKKTGDHLATQQASILKRGERASKVVLEPTWWKERANFHICTVVCARTHSQK